MGDKPLFDPMMVKFTGAYINMRQSAKMSSAANELICLFSTNESSK